MSNHAYQFGFSEARLGHEEGTRKFDSISEGRVDGDLNLVPNSLHSYQLPQARWAHAVAVHVVHGLISSFFRCRILVPLRRLPRTLQPGSRHRARPGDPSARLPHL